MPSCGTKDGRPPPKSLPDYGIFSTMGPGHFVLHDREFQAFQAVLKRLLADSLSRVVFLVDKNGSLMASSGDADDFDTTSIASLAAGNVAATGGLAALIGEKEFSSLFHQGEKDSMHMSVISDRLILVVIFDARTQVGLVRLRVRKASEEIAKILAEVEAVDTIGPIEELTDDDIESLFR